MAVIGAAFGMLDSLGPGGAGGRRPRGLHGHERAPARGDAPRLQDVRGPDAGRGDPGHRGRPARLPRAARVERLPRRRLPQPGGHGRGPRGAHRLRAGRPPRRDRGDRDRAAAHRGDLDRASRSRVTKRGDRGLGPRRQPAARERPGAHRPRDRLPARGRLPGRLRLQARSAPAPPRGGRGLRPPHEGAAPQWGLDNGGARVATNGPVLAYCQEMARQLVAALRDLETLQPGEMEGLLREVESAKR